MTLHTVLAFSLACLCLSLPLPGQNQPATPPSSVLKEYDQAIDQVAEHVMRSVVQIEITGYGVPEHSEGKDAQLLERQRALGSGVIVSPDGYIVTNNHVVAGAIRIRVILAPATVELVTGHTVLSHHQRVYDATLIGASRYADLAVIKIEEKNLPALPLSERFQIRLGQTVLAIGSPEGLDHTVTKGIVSAVGRQPELDRPMVYVQTDAPINPGNSGGPLVDRDGNLVGINTFIFTSGGGSEGLGFAIPEPIVHFAYEQIKATGVVPSITIGAHAQTITPALAMGLKLSQDLGVILSDVEPDSPAAKAGLRPQDIVASVDGVPIDSLPKYAAFLYLHPRGRPMDMQVLREGKPVNVSLMPVAAPPTLENLSDLINPKTDLIAPLGIFVIGLQGSLSDALMTRSKSGVIVAGLLGGEPATFADLRAGDVITALNGKPVASAAELHHALAGFQPGDAVVLAVERQSVLLYVAFEME